MKMLKDLIKNEVVSNACTVDIEGEHHFVFDKERTKEFCMFCNQNKPKETFWS